MRVLLINSNRLKNPPVIPIGLCYIASSIEDAGHEVRVLDLCFSSDPATEIGRAIAEATPDIVGITIRNIDTCTATNPEFLIDDVLSGVIRPIKGAFSGPIVIGGPAVGISGAEILAYLDLEYAIVGDGELAIVEFVRRLENKESLSGLGGLIIRQNGVIIEENQPYRPRDIDNLPLPEIWRHIDLKPYRQFDAPLQIQTKRGCELSCSYCTYNLIEGKKYRLRDPQKVAREIESLVRATGIRRIEFTDSTFNVPSHHAKAVLRAIVELNIKLDLRTMGVNPSAVDEELVDLMKKAGFRDLDLGIEACDNGMLKSLGKNFSVQDIARSAKLLQKKGIPVRFFLLLGAPGETGDTLKNTFHSLDKIVGSWDIVTVSMGLRVYKGSPIAHDLSHRKAHVPMDNYLKPFFLEPEGMDFGELRKVVRNETSGNPNYHVNEDDRKLNYPKIRIVITQLMKLVAPEQPIWRFYILIQKVKSALMMTALRKAISRTKHS